jgi:hypothetical protein
MVRLAVAVLLAACSGGDPSEDPRNPVSGMAEQTPSRPTVIEATAEAVQSAFSDRDELVVTLSGYSGSGYEDEDALMRRARALLGEYDPESTIINIGATVDGIGAVYEIASQMGFETTGIVSSQALESDATFSPFVDRVYVIADEQWGGMVEGTDRLSPTSEAMVAVSDVYLAIGGGAVARDEAVAARARGKEVRFYPADLDHRRAIERAEARGEPAPTDFRGAAHAVLGDGQVGGG